MWYHHLYTIKNVFFNYLHHDARNMVPFKYTISLRLKYKGNKDENK